MSDERKSVVDYLRRRAIEHAIAAERTPFDLDHYRRERMIMGILFQEADVIARMEFP